MGSEPKQKAQDHLLLFVLCAVFLTFCVIRVSRNGQYDETVTWLAQKSAVRCGQTSSVVVQRAVEAPSPC
jgi:hypothetical protein